MNLTEYRKKRDFTKTPEPKGGVGKKGKQTIFVVQEHWATHHYFDLRLEMEGVLKSWAVPKGVPETPGVKRLAIAVEDHPLAYAEFEGTIPEGLYGAGVVKIWDEGSYELSNQDKDRLEFVLRGKKLKGSYLMVKMRGRSQQWLLWKKR